MEWLEVRIVIIIIIIIIIMDAMQYEAATNENE